MKNTSEETLRQKGLRIKAKRIKLDCYVKKVQYYQLKIEALSENLTNQENVLMSLIPPAPENTFLIRDFNFYIR